MTKGLRGCDASCKVWVYCAVESDETTTVKIGITKNLQTRLHSMQVNNPRRVEFLFSRAFQDKERAMKVEAAIHSRFDRQRLRPNRRVSEWFELTSTVLDSIVGWREGGPMPGERNLTVEDYAVKFG